MEVADDRYDCEIFDLQDRDRELNEQELKSYHAAKLIFINWQAMWDMTPDSTIHSPDEFFHCVRDKIYPAVNGIDDPIVSFSEDQTRLKHATTCDHTQEGRLILLPRKEILDAWPICVANEAEFGLLFDAILSQHQLYVKDDCCTFYDLHSRSQSAVSMMVSRLSREPFDTRQTIMMNMAMTRLIPEADQRLLCTPDKETTRAVPATSINTMIPQLVIPTAAQDCSEKSILAMIRYVNQAISSNQDPRTRDWSSSMKIHLGNIVFNRKPKAGRTVADKVLWQHYPADRLLVLLKSLLPETNKLSTENEIGRSALQVFQSYLLENPFHAKFDIELGGYHELITLKSEIEVELDKLKREGGIPNPNDEQVMAKRLWKNFGIYGLQEKSLHELELEIQTKCERVHDFEQVLENITEVVLEKFIMLKKAYDFLPPGKQPRAPTFGPENAMKKQKTLPKHLCHKNFTKIGDTSQPGICDGCGWALKCNKPPHRTGVIPDPKMRGVPTIYRCTRGVDREGCGSDNRRNTSQETWAESQVGIQWKEAGYSSLPKDTSITLLNAKERHIATPKAHTSSAKTSGKSACMINECNKLLQTTELIPFSVLHVQAPRETRRMTSGGTGTSSGKSKDSAPTFNLLLDTGAIGACVVSDKFVSALQSHGINYHSKHINHELNSALNESAITNQEISFNISLVSDNSSVEKPIQLAIKAIVAPIGVDLIIDKAMIKQYRLVQHFPSHFVDGTMLELLSSTPIEEREQEQPAAKKRKLPSRAERKELGQAKKAARRLKRENIRLGVLKEYCTNAHNIWVDKQRAIVSKQQELYREGDLQPSYLATLNTKPLSETRIEDPSDLERKHSLLYNLTSNFSTKSAYERDGNLHEIPDNKLESIPAELISDVHSENDYKKVHIEGGALVRQALLDLVEEFKDIFSTTVQKVPAKLIPFKLTLDKEKWDSPANQLKCRRLDNERDTELSKMVKILLDAHVIEACDAKHYSHAFLVPKPNGKWRLVLDFKNLNDATHNYYKWPLPDIKEMLNRVGDSRPEFFAVFDLTSGYYQAEIDEESREFTAFLTRHGVYRWLRLPMGLTGACSYFQKSLSTQVLHGLMHNGTELYLDDCMVHADTLDLYLKRLRQVFLRFRESNITLNPTKCKLGLPKVEFVGHTIDRHGLHFTRDKLDSVLNFPRPETKKQVKSFLGLANYFRDHILNHSNRVQPLQEFVNGYDKKQARQKIVWTDASIAAFEDIRRAIDECPMLWFIDDFSPIFLRTDASDYGIGAYLYQVRSEEDGSEKEYPIGFISKSIASQHQSWDTPMKEGFAIFYALHKWEYLLKDRRFTILTDHKNLTQLRQDHDTNKMVKRWFMCYQDYDVIEWKHVAGEDNMVPDQFSRQCEELEDVHPTVKLFQLTGYEIPQEHWDTIAQFHNTGIRKLVAVTPDNTSGVVCPGGHGGVNRTLSQLDDAGLQWRHRTKHVRRFIKLCPCCQKMNQMKNVIHSYPFTLSTYGLWHTISVDYIERLQVDEYGNNMIIVLTDNFSRFTDLYATNSTNAEGAADALLSFCGSYVTPQHFTTDSGANFASKIVAGLMERLGADHFLTTAYSKEMNGLVERQNKEVLRHLRNIIFDRRLAAKWTKYLPLVQRVLNATRHSSTGLTPSEIVFPNGVQLDKSLLTESSSVVVSSYISDLQRAQALVLSIAEESLRSMDRKHMEEYSPLRTVFEDGSHVLVEHRHNALRRGPVSKLLPFLKGPLLVKQHNPKTGIYVLQDLVTGNCKDYHVSNLREFLYDERTLTPMQAALTDTLDEFVAEKVIRMKGDTRGSRANLSFRIRWAGYGEADDTWEEWKNCRDSFAVQTFLREHKDKRVRKLAKPIELDDSIEDERMSVDDA